MLLDEPTSSLDINYQGEIYDLLKYLNKNLKLTIITVSHDLNLTAQYCEKLLLIKDGIIFASGSAEEVLTKSNIKEVYNTEVLIKKNPLSNRPFITLIPAASLQENKNNKDFKIHIIAGGGTTKNFLSDLLSLGYQITLGVLNIGDADWQLARELGLEMAEADPFENITEEEVRENKEMISKADLIILTNLPFGNGNLANLKVLEEFPNKKKILFNNIEIEKEIILKGKLNLSGINY